MSLLINAAIIVSALIFLYWDWDGSPPVISWPSNVPEVVSGQTPIQLTITDEGKGLAQVSVILVQDSYRTTVLRESMTRSWLPWDTGNAQRELTFTPMKTKGTPALKDGPFSVEVHVEDHPSWWLFQNSVVSTQNFQLDRSPPEVILLSKQHTLRLRQGGSEALRYSTSRDTITSGVSVGERSFRGYRQSMADTDEFVCIFALAYNAPLDTPVVVWAEDQVGNRAETTVPIQLRERRFRQREINISDTFIDNVLPDILQQSGLTPPETQVERFLLVNATMRQKNNAQIEEINARSTNQALWSEPFIQLSNSQVEAAFADERSYMYQGEKIDEQTHLGFDLASIAHGPVEAANAGTVMHAAYLGIYGNCVMLDHGLGMMSLYAHMSQIDVAEGQAIRRGEILGKTGKTGLAGGDHLHFGILVQGVSVTPLEWWDPKWVKNHFLSRIQ
jgi:hypothetical protein